MRPVLAVLPLLAMLTACGSVGGSESASRGSSASESTIYSVVLKNGRTVDCVVADGNKSGSMDCGWETTYESSLSRDDNTDLLSEIELKNSSGRTVTCVEAAGNYLSGISCDWQAK